MRTTNAMLTIKASKSETRLALSNIQMALQIAIKDTFDSTATRHGIRNKIIDVANKLRHVQDLVERL